MKAATRIDERTRGWDDADRAAIHRRVQRHARERGWDEERVRLEDCDGLGDGGSLWWFFPFAAFTPFLFFSELFGMFRGLGHLWQQVFGEVDADTQAAHDAHVWNEIAVLVIWIALLLLGSLGCYGFRGTLEILGTKIPRSRRLRGESVIALSRRVAEGKRPRYYVTLEREDGSSREYRTSKAAYSKVAPGDAGFAFLTEGRLWDYRPYRIR